MCRSCRVSDRFLKHDGFTVVRVIRETGEMFPVYDPTTRKPRRYVSLSLAEGDAKRMALVDKILPDSSGSLAPVTIDYRAIPVRVVSH